MFSALFSQVQQADPASEKETAADMTKQQQVTPNAAETDKLKSLDEQKVNAPLSSVEPAPSPASSTAPLTAPSTSAGATTVTPSETTVRGCAWLSLNLFRFQVEFIGASQGPWEHLPTEFRSYAAVKCSLGLVQPGTVFKGQGKGQRKHSDKVCFACARLHFSSCACCAEHDKANPRAVVYYAEKDATPTKADAISINAIASVSEQLDAVAFKPIFERFEQFYADKAASAAKSKTPKRKSSRKPVRASFVIVSYCDVDRARPLAKSLAESRKQQRAGAAAGHVQGGDREESGGNEALPRLARTKKQQKTQRATPT